MPEGFPMNLHHRRRRHLRLRWGVAELPRRDEHTWLAGQWFTLPSNQTPQREDCRFIRLLCVSPEGRQFCHITGCWPSHPDSSGDAVSRVSIKALKAEIKVSRGLTPSPLGSCHYSLPSSQTPNRGHYMQHQAPRWGEAGKSEPFLRQTRESRSTPI